MQQTESGSIREAPLNRQHRRAVEALMRHGMTEAEAVAEILTDGALEVSEFCTVYRISRTAFYEEIKAKRLTVKKLGAKTLIPRTNARAWLAALPDLESIAA